MINNCIAKYDLNEQYNVNSASQVFEFKNNINNLYDATWLDTTGNTSYNGTVYHKPVFIETPVGQSLQFDGRHTVNNDTIFSGVVLPSYYMAGKHEFSISTLLKGTGIIFNTNGYPNSNNPGLQGIAISTDSVDFGHNSFNSFYTPLEEPTNLNEIWYHYTFTFIFNKDGSSMFNLYINGVFICCSNLKVMLNPISTNILLGTSCCSGFNGLMNHFCIYDKCLSDAEVTDVYNNQNT